MSKFCKKCQKDKPSDEWSLNNTESNGSPYCLECMREVNKQNYIKHKEKHNKRCVVFRKKGRELFYDYKKTCICSKCKDDRWYVLDFHHKDPNQKKDNISVLLRKSHKKLWEELKKCISLCRNCHTEFHYLEKTQNITIEEYLA
jgi:hypothetical protein